MSFPNLPGDGNPQFDARGVCHDCGGYAEHFAGCPANALGLRVVGEPEHQPRERAVGCAIPYCSGESWRFDGLCPRHEPIEGADARDILGEAVSSLSVTFLGAMHLSDEFFDHPDVTVAIHLLEDTARDLHRRVLREQRNAHPALFDGRKLA